MSELMHDSSLSFRIQALFFLSVIFKLLDFGLQVCCLMIPSWLPHHQVLFFSTIFPHYHVQRQDLKSTKQVDRLERRVGETGVLL